MIPVRLLSSHCERRCFSDVALEGLECFIRILENSAFPTDGNSPFPSCLVSEALRQHCDITGPATKVSQECNSQPLSSEPPCGGMPFQMPSLRREHSHKTSIRFSSQTALRGLALCCEGNDKDFLAHLSSKAGKASLVQLPPCTCCSSGQQDRGCLRVVDSWFAFDWWLPCM